jgi:hypothetical protein
MQSLVLADDLHADTLEGRKKNTIRNGLRDIFSGPLEFKSSTGTLSSFVVEVVEVLHKKAADVKAVELRDNGFLDHAHMLSGMKRFYPDFGPSSDITLVRWR